MFLKVHPTVGVLIFKSACQKLLPKTIRNCVCQYGPRKKQSAQPSVVFYQRSTSGFCVCRSQKCKKDSQVVSLFLSSGSAHVKAAHRMLMRSTPGIHFINILQADFTCPDSKSAKDSQVVSLFCAFGICKLKSCS